jgi:hypothetical protein
MRGVTFTELVPPPASGRVFEQALRPGLADCGPTGRARLDGLARMLQDVAYADIDDAGVADLSLWVVRRMRIKVERFPRFGDHVRGRTFCSGMGRLWAERRTTIEGEGALVESVGLGASGPEDRAPGSVSRGGGAPLRRVRRRQEGEGTPSPPGTAR